MKTIRGVLLFLMVAAAVLLNASCGETDPAPGNIVQYHIDSILVPASTAIHDTLNIGIGLYLDCTNGITRIDTSYQSMRFTIAVYGTVYTGDGPPPLCPAMYTRLNFFIVPDQVGTLTIEALQPSGESLIDSVSVFRPDASSQ